jgi:lambda repressor-like predicted transcriptional regulator
LKEKYFREKQRLVAEVLAMDPKYIPPYDYKPPKKTKKIFVPTTE